MRQFKESTIQINCVQWARTQYPVLDKLLLSIPNGGKRPKKQNSKGRWYTPDGAILKKEGLVKGAADLLLAVPTPECPGVFIEMKAPGGRLSDDQKDFKAAVEKAGYKYVVLLDIDNFMVFVNMHMSQSIFKRTIR